MPKIKVLDSRQTPEEVVVMSWSPKMDLLAIGNRKGQIHLHRLSWQKVWQVPLAIKDTAEVAHPELMVWHPEGLFLVVTSGNITFVIDVEGGKVVHSHEISHTITAARWCSSNYNHSMNDVLSSNPRQQQTDIKITRLEANLSVLFLGTSNGYVYAYTGGFLLGLCIPIGDENTSPRVLQVDCTKSLESFVFLSDEEANGGGGDEMAITFNHFRNDYLPRMAPIIGPLGLKYILFLKNWAVIQSELLNLNEVWARMVELYTTYMTFGGTRDIEIVRADFVELLLTGISTVEMEIFLGSVGREKEAKKNTNVINSANASMTEHIRTIKCSIVNLLTELNEIGGFLQQISGYEEANCVIIELRKASSYLFLSALNVQSLVHNFVEVSLHFMHLVMNTIHSFNIQELPDFIEEDADTDKVLEFLNFKVEKDILRFLFVNVKVGHDPDEECVKAETVVDNKLPDVETSTDDKPKTLGQSVKGGENKYKDFANFVQSLLLKSSLPQISEHPLLLDYSRDKVEEIVNNIGPMINGFTKKLLSIPVLCSVPFEVEAFPIIRLPMSDYFSLDSDTEPIESRIRKPFQMFLDEEKCQTFVKFQLTRSKILMAQVDLSDHKKFLLKCTLFNFSRTVLCSEIFSSSHLTVVSYDKLDKRNELQDMGRTIVCQLPYSSLMTRAPHLELNQLKSKCGAKASLPLVIFVDIPLDICKPSPSCSDCIDYLLPIEGFAPQMVTLSCPRKVGALLGDDKRTVLLLEMELEFTESTLEDGCDEDDSGED